MLYTAFSMTALEIERLTNDTSSNGLSVRDRLELVAELKSGNTVRVGARAACNDKLVIYSSWEW